MATFEFRLPDIGEGTVEAECVAWHVSPGDMVAEDHPLLEVMTDKATVEVTSPVAGKVLTRAGAVGDALSVGSVVLVFEVSDEAGGDADVPRDPNVEPQVGKSHEVPCLHTSPGLARAEIGGDPHRVLAAPALRKRAADHGVDLNLIKGSGPHGRVRQSDLEAFLINKPEAPPIIGAMASPKFPFAAEQGGTLKPVIGLRRRIAERMQDTKRRIPHFSYIEETDLTSLEALRVRLNSDGQDRPRLTLLPFLIRALVTVLPEFPQLNARYDDAAGVLHEHAEVHVGIATQTPNGLVVTVLRDAAKKDLWDCAAEIQRLADLARSGKAKSHELSGSTITISSLGAIGGVATTPVINSPEVAILGINKLVERPIVRDGRIEVAKMMNLSTSFDHRIVDGWDAAMFVQRLKQFLEVPANLFVR